MGKGNPTMHIEIHIFPDSFPIDPESWRKEMLSLGLRIEKIILDGTVNGKAYAMGKTTLLDNENSGIVVATIDIRRE